MFSRLSFSRTPGGRAFTGLAVAFGISSIGFGAVSPFLVIWGHRDAGLPGAAAGLLFVAQACGEISGGLIGGLIADRLGARLVLIASTTGMALGFGLLTLVHSPATAIVLIYLEGLFEAAYHPTGFALVADLTPSESRVRAYSLVRMASNLGAIIGPLAGAAVVAGADLSDVFLACGGFLALSGVALAVTVPRRGAHVDLAEEAEELRDAVPGLHAITRDRRLLLLVLGGGLLTITLAWWEADGLAVLRTQRHFSTGDFSALLALTAALTLLLQIPLTRATAGVQRTRLLPIGAVLQAVGVCLLAAASAGLVLVIASVVLIALGDMLYGPNLSALVSDIAPAGRGATYQAALSTTADIGMAGGPASGLALSAGLGAPAMWLLGLPAGCVAAWATGRAAQLSAPSVRAPG